LQDHFVKCLYSVITGIVDFFCCIGNLNEYICAGLHRHSSVFEFQDNVPAPDVANNLVKFLFKNIRPTDSADARISFSLAVECGLGAIYTMHQLHFLMLIMALGPFSMAATAQILLLAEGFPLV
jgi:hypothetical protein